MKKVPAINKEQAQTIYHAVLEGLYGKFRASDRPDFRMRALEVRGIVVPGVFGERRRPSWLKIVLDPESFSEPDLMRHFNRTEGGNVRAPRIRVRGETSMGYPWFITDDVEGKRLLSPKRYNNGDPRLTRLERERVSEIFWTITEDMLVRNPLPGQGPAPVIWFDDRITKWLRRGQENGALRKHLITPSTLLKAVETLRQSSADFPAPGTHFSHAHFANTEIRITDLGYTLLDWGHAKFVPFMYDAAFWVWHATLYSFNVPTKNWLLEVEDYEDAFCSHARRIAGRELSETSIRFAFRACLLERMLGALLIDCAEGAPTSLPILEQRQVLRNTRATLRLMIQGLS